MTEIKDLAFKLSTAELLVENGVDIVDATLIATEVADVSRKVVNTMIEELDKLPKKHRLLISVMVAENCMNRFSDAITMAEQTIKARRGR